MIFNFVIIISCFNLIKIYEGWVSGFVLAASGEMNQTAD
jgi:hypothetical protein